MARSLYAGRAGDTVVSVFTLARRQVLTLPVDTNGNPTAVQLEVYDGVDGTRVTDLLAADGLTSISVVTASVSDGQVPAFYGPDAVNTSLWLRDPDGDYIRVEPDAVTSAEVAAGHAAAAAADRNLAQLARDTAETAAGQASDSALAAGDSKDAAALSETNAGDSETNAAGSAAAAFVSETNAGESEALAAEHRAAVEGVVATSEGVMTSVLGSGGTFDDELATVIATQVPAATTTTPGRVELATTAETTTGTDTARAVTPAGVKAAIDALVNGAPGALDTLKELSDALGADPDYAATTAAAIASKVTKWQAATVYAADDVRQAPDGSAISRIASGTSRATFDATEQAAWETVIAKTGTLDQVALTTTIDTAVPDATTTTKGRVELATTAETTTGTDTVRAVTPASAAANFPRVVNRSAYATLADAITAAGSGGTVHYNDGNYNEAATTISTPVTLTGNRVTIYKTANGAVLTITAANVKISKGITINGQASTYTGPGVVFSGNGTTSDPTLDCNVVNCHQWAVDVGIGAAQRGVFGAGLFSTSNKTATDAAMTSGSPILTSATAAFTANDVGKYALVQGALTSAHTTWYLISKVVSVDSATQVTLADNASRTVSGAAMEMHFPAFRFGAETAAGVTGDRHMIGTHTGGYLLADIGGVQTLDMTATNSRGLIFSSTSCSKVSASGSNRFATSGGTTLIHGINHSFVGATFAGDVVLSANANTCVVKSNVSGDVYDYGTDNDVQGQQMRPLPPHSVDPRLLNTTGALNANQAIFLRCRGRGYISKIALHVGTSSGNISVGVYANGTGTGQAAQPTTRKATSGTVACPAAGYAEIALTAPVYVEEGDWLALSADNNTATFYRGTNHGFSTNMAKGVCAHQSTAHPLPSPAVVSVGSLYSVILVGVA